MRLLFAVFALFFAFASAAPGVYWDKLLRMSMEDPAPQGHGHYGTFTVWRDGKPYVLSIDSSEPLEFRLKMLQMNQNSYKRPMIMFDSRGIGNGEILVVIIALESDQQFGGQKDLETCDFMLIHELWLTLPYFTLKWLQRVGEHNRDSLSV
uniref:Secreted protein n=1 Tax=Steinernema glaseri TaxID=37863 RepID=A0A1I7YY56_9BILA